MRTVPGTQVAPPSGTRVAPPSGTRVAPPSGTRVAPPSGTRVVPPSGTQVAPPSGTRVAPFSKDTHLLCYNITQCFAGLCNGKCETLCQSQSPPVIALPFLLHVPLFCPVSIVTPIFSPDCFHFHSSSHTSRVLIYQDVTGALPFPVAFCILHG